LLAEEAVAEGVGILEEFAGVRVAGAPDTALGAMDLKPNDAVLFDKLGIAVVNPEPREIKNLIMASSEMSPILAVEPDRIVYAIPDFTPQLAKEIEMLQAQSQMTWGLLATKVDSSRLSGKGTKIAVLDTGLDLGHPDFANRRIVSQSFVAGETAQDGHGHGTHCVGTACGPRQPSVLPRYGIGYDCEIFVAKVLNDQGRGSDQQILAGINWAITNNCTIVSMSLGKPVLRGEPLSEVFETAARRALTLGTLIIAAAGNDSRRDLGHAPSPVAHPANCPSVLAVGAVDVRMQVAYFSNSGPVGIAGPGVGVHSSSSLPTRYRTLSGTSMATPHVAGIAALHSEANPTLGGYDLRTLLVKTARPLRLPPSDVGPGLVQAP